MIMNGITGMIGNNGLIETVHWGDFPSRGVKPASALHAALLTCLLCFCCPEVLQGEAVFRGKVDNPDVGVGFEIPKGWAGELSGEVLVMRHPSVSATLLLIEHEHRDVEALREELASGVSEEGFSLRISGTFQEYGERGVAAEYIGSIHGEPGWAYVVSLLNPYGKGLSLMVIRAHAETEDSERESLRALALGFAESIQFSSSRMEEASGLSEESADVVSGDGGVPSWGPDSGAQGR